MSRVLSGTIVAAFLGCAAVSAQAPAKSPATDEQQSGAQAFTVTGCVQKEAAVLKRSAVAGNVGMSDEFVLTNALLKKSDAVSDKAKTETEPPSAETPSAEPVGTSGSASNFGKVYRVTGDKESELKTYVGQRVEIAGSFKKDEDAKTELGAVGTSGRAVAGEPTTENTPEITITSIKPVPGSCSGGAIK
jgi:hypothetical protein